LQLDENYNTKTIQKQYKMNILQQNKMNEEKLIFKKVIDLT